jgi:flavin reductase (DIM6/NTAB) family NADH-FMN oxidoreductase RutF
MDKKASERALHFIPYGLYVLGSVKGQTVAAIVVNWVTQVSFNPALVAIAIEEESRMRAYIEGSQHFAINILPSDGIETARSFIRPVETIGNKINGRDFILSRNGLPFLKDAIASIECRVVSSYKTGDHIMFIGEVTDAVTHSERDVLTLKKTGWNYRRKGGSHKS